jgi:single-strand DNA-binding protein
MSNSFSFVGTVGKNAEVRHLPSGQAVLSVSIANHVGFGEKRQTIWILVSLWGKRAEGSLKNFLVAGQEFFVSGELTLREYQANDGTMKTSLDVNATTIDLVGKREESAPINERPVPAVKRPTPPVVEADDDCCHFFDYDSSPSTNTALKYPENGAPYDDDDIPF